MLSAGRPAGTIIRLPSSGAQSFRAVLGPILLGTAPPPPCTPPVRDVLPCSGGRRAI